MVTALRFIFAFRSIGEQALGAKLKIPTSKLSCFAYGTSSGTFCVHRTRRIER